MYWDNFFLLFRFAVESYVANYIFIFTLQRREKFWLRLLLSAVVIIALLFVMAAACVYIPLDDSAKQIGCFILLLGPLNFGWLFLCFKDSPWNIIFCAVFGLLTKLGAISIIEAIKVATENTFLSFFGEEDAVGLVIQYVIIALTYVMIYIFLGRRHKRSDSFIKCGKRMIPLYLFTVIMIPVISVAETNIAEIDVIYRVILEICEAAICFLVISIQFAFSRQMVSEGQKATLDALLVESQKQFNTLQESMEIINLKCHDMRHQIRSLESGKINDDYIRELAKTISIYDSTIKTGNSVLDIILTDKSLRCTANKIDFTCIADGEKLTIMSESDINSLFGNAIENAMQYEESIEDAERRFISLIVKSEADILFIRVENYWCGEPLHWNNGLPVSTKGEGGITHGFGMLSMRRVVEKYGGEMQVKAENELFQVIITIPLK